MRALLDTHTFLWWVTDSDRLSKRAMEIISKASNEFYFSAASGWEMAIKAALGKLELPANLNAFIAEELANNAIQALPIHLYHALHVKTLPHHHRDPFDRMLIAQSQLERLPIISIDGTFADYDVEVLW